MGGNAEEFLKSYLSWEGACRDEREGWANEESVEGEDGDVG